MDEGFEAFRARVMRDPALQRWLDTGVCPDTFETDAAAIAGGGVAPGRLRPGGRRAEIGLSRDWAPEGWLPVRVHGGDAGPIVDWAHFGDAAIDASFFHDAAARAVARPFNRVFRHATRLDDFVANARLDEAVPVRGFVFHMSRCGSTLVSRMFGALPGTVSLSEPGPLDAVVRLAFDEAHPREGCIAALRAMVAALARRRGDAHQCVIKLDSWHILALPLLREAFSEVPWIYLFRDPVEVLVSQLRMRGYQTVPELMPPGLYALDGVSAARPELLCARILAQFHAAALTGLRAGEGMAVDYADLPGAVPERIAAHFGVVLDADAHAALARAALHDSKAPGQAFARDGEAKRRAADAALQEAASEHLGAAHDALKALARGQARSILGG